MIRGTILWADDEIDLLQPHIMYLEERGYKVTGVTNGEDAISHVKEEDFDLVLLDQMMSGRDGLSTLEELKQISPGLPVIMITKHEEESLMDEAIAGKITDYLTKPVNPSQILSACKKILEKKQISSDRMSRDHVSEFNKISELLNDQPSANTWIDIHTKLSEMEVELDSNKDSGLEMMLSEQRKECNTEFGKFVTRNYASWVTDARSESPTLSTDIFSRFVYPLLKEESEVVFVVVDCMRLDQWFSIEDILYEYFNITRNYAYSILPTATPFSRNAIFSGLFPNELSKAYPEIWQKAWEDEHSMNRHEEIYLNNQLERLKIELKPAAKYSKILNINEGKKIEKQIPTYGNVPLITLVVNFVDILTHTRSESDVLKEIAPDESGFRNLTRSWFENSWLYKVLIQLSEMGKTIILTTDHGSIRVTKGTQVLGDRATSTGLRYKYGRSLKCDDKDAFLLNNPEDWNLPSSANNTNFIFAINEHFFLYPTNYNKYLNLYKNTFQHGGISLEEMILPVLTLKAKH
ncbi:MAG: response regulator [Candidatus Marinimicrobia bacterium]|nr:response regulator [Candidatus Neomarinimicrobiota bacterium]